MLAGPPADAADARQWLGVFEAEFPGAQHRTFGIDGTGGSAADGDSFAALGLETEVSTVMTATSVHEPPRPNHEATYRPLESDADWEQQVELTMAGEEIGYDREFCEGRARQHRRLAEAGHGQYWGAFEDGRLLSSMGLFRASPGTGAVPDRQDPPRRPRPGAWPGRWCTRSAGSGSPTSTPRPW